MKNKTYKRTQKIIIAILIVLSFNFIVPTFSLGMGDLAESVGGILLRPLTSFMLFICDSVVGGLQNFMYDNTFGFSIGGFMKHATDLDNLMKKYPELEVPKDYNPEKDGALNINANELERTLTDQVQIPILVYSPEKIFSGKVPALDVNFINPEQFDTDEMNDKSITQALQQTIASWYVALRNLAIVGLLSVLLYVGIRMVISSTSSDKAKYKQMLMDWVVSLCILFFLHYIMSFTLTLTQMITDGINGRNSVVVNLTGSLGNYVEENQGGHLQPGGGDASIPIEEWNMGNKNKEETETTEGEEENKGDSTGGVTFATSLMGAVRLQTQYSEFGKKVVYLIMYIALVCYTAMFTWKYVKRAITMAFLTLMAPLVALTYPIDKIGDGKAQAFNTWLKEYIFNALLQPFHLIIYTIFLGSSMEIAVNNPVYAILFLAFITPAEKILRKFFGFDKSSTVGALDSAGKMLGGATAFKAVSGLMKKSAGNIAAKATGGGAGSRGIRGADQSGYLDTNEQGKDTSIFNGTGSDNEENAQTESWDNNDMYLNSGNYQESETLSNAREQQLALRGQNTTSNGQQSTAQITTGTQQSGSSQPPTIRESRQLQANSATATTASTQAQTSRNNNTNQTNADRSIIRGIANIPGKKFQGAKEQLRQLTDKDNPAARRMLERKVAGSVARNSAKLAIAGAGVVAGTALGVGLGIAGDDLEDVLSLGVAGATLGGAVANKALGSRVDGAVSSMGASFMEGYYGDANEAAMVAETDRIVTDQESRDYVGSELGLEGKELDNAMRDFAHFKTQGIQDNKQALKAMKLSNDIESSDGVDKDTADKMALYVSRLGEDKNMVKLLQNEEGRSELLGRFERTLKKSDVNNERTPKQRKQDAKYMLDLFKKQQKMD